MPAPFLSRFEKYIINVEDFYQLQVARFSRHDQTTIAFARAKCKEFVDAIGADSLYGVAKHPTTTIASLLLSHMKTDKDRCSFAPSHSLPPLRSQQSDLVRKTLALLGHLLRILPAEALISRLLPAVSDDKLFAQIYFDHQEHFSLESFTANAITATERQPQKHIIYVRATVASLFLSQLVEKWPNRLQTATMVLEPHGQQCTVLKRSLDAFVRNPEQRVLFLVVNAADKTDETASHVSYLRSTIDEHAAGNGPKHFVVLIAFPPENMYISSCYPTVFFRNWQFHFFDTLSSGGSVFIKQFAQKVHGTGASNDAIDPANAVYVNSILSATLYEFAALMRPAADAGTKVELDLIESEEVRAFYDLKRGARERAAKLSKALQSVESIWNHLLSHVFVTFSRESIVRLIRDKAESAMLGQTFEALSDAVAGELKQYVRAYCTLILVEFVKDIGLDSMVRLAGLGAKQTVAHLFALVALPDSSRLVTFRPETIALNQPYPFKLFLFRLVHERIDRAFKHVRERALPATDLGGFVDKLAVLLEKEAVLANVFRHERIGSHVVQFYVHDLVCVKGNLFSSSGGRESVWLARTLQRWIMAKIDCATETNGLRIIASVIGTLDASSATFNSLLLSGRSAARFYSAEGSASVSIEQLSAAQIEDVLLEGVFKQLWAQFGACVLNGGDDALVAQWLDDLHFLANHFGPGEALPGLRFKDMRTKIDYMLVGGQVILLPIERQRKAMLLKRLHAEGGSSKSTANSSFLLKSIAELIKHELTSIVQETHVPALKLQQVIATISQFIRWFVLSSTTAAILENSRFILDWVHDPFDKDDNDEEEEEEDKGEKNERHLMQHIFNVLASHMTSSKLLKSVAGRLAAHASKTTVAPKDLVYAPIHDRPRHGGPEVLTSRLADFYYQYAIEHDHAPTGTAPRTTSNLLEALAQAMSEYKRVEIKEPTRPNKEGVIILILTRAVIRERIYRTFLSYLGSFAETAGLTGDDFAAASQSSSPLLKEVYKLLTGPDFCENGRLLLIARMYHSINRSFTKRFLSMPKALEVLGDPQPSGYVYYVGDPSQVTFGLEDVPAFMLSPVVPQWSFGVPFEHLYPLYPVFHSLMETAAATGSFAPLLDWFAQQRSFGAIKPGECHMLLVLEMHHVYSSSRHKLAPLRALLVVPPGSPSLVALGLDLFPEHVRALLAFVDPETFFASLQTTYFGRLFRTAEADLDWEDVRKRHALANLLALTMGSSSRDHPIWTFTFAPEKLQDTFGFASVYNKVISTYHYDCGTVINETGVFRNPHRDSMAPPALYVATIMTHGALCWALSMKAAATDTTDELLSSLVPNILSPNALDEDGNNVHEKYVHLAFSRVSSAWVFLIKESRPREDVPMLFNRVVERYAWLAPQQSGECFSATFNSFAHKVRAENLFTLEIVCAVDENMPAFFVNQAEQAAKAESYWTAYSSTAIRDTASHLMASLSSTQSDRDLTLLRDYCAHRGEFQLLRELPMLLRLYNLLHSSLHGLVTADEALNNPLKYFVDHGLLRATCPPKEVATIIAEGYAAFNRVHSGLKGALQGGVCLTKDDFSRIDYGKTSLAYLLTFPSQDINDVLIKVMTALIAVPNSFLARVVGYYHTEEQQQQTSAKGGDTVLEEEDEEEEEDEHRRVFGLLLGAIKLSASTKEDNLEVMQASPRARRLLITGDADKHEYHRFAALAESTRSPDAAAAANEYFDLRGLQLLVLSQEILGRHTLTLDKVRAPFVFKKTTNDDSNRNDQRQASVLDSLEHPGLAAFQSPFASNDIVSALDSLRLDDLRQALDDLSAVVTMLALRGNEHEQIDPGTTGLRAWMRACTGVDGSWCPESLCMANLCETVRLLKRNNESQTHLIVRMDPAVCVPLPLKEREGLQQTIVGLANDRGLDNTLALLVQTLEAMSDCEGHVLPAVHASSDDHALSVFFENMGSQNDLTDAIAPAILDVHFAYTRLELLNWRTQVLTMQRDAELKRAAPSGPPPTPKFELVVHWGSVAEATDEEQESPVEEDAEDEEEEGPILSPSTTETTDDVLHEALLELTMPPAALVNAKETDDPWARIECTFEQETRVVVAIAHCNVVGAADLHLELAEGGDLFVHTSDSPIQLTPQQRAEQVQRLTGQLVPKYLTSADAVLAGVVRATHLRVDVLLQLEGLFGAGSDPFHVALDALIQGGDGYADAVQRVYLLVQRTPNEEEQAALKTLLLNSDVDLIKLAADPVAFQRDWRALAMKKK